MSRLVDLTGKMFGKWKVIERAGKASSGNYKWLCECSCGTRKEVDGNSLKSGRSTKCRHCFIPANKTKYSKDPITVVFSGMKDRCNNPNHKSYENYGGRGIKIFQDWIDNPVSFYDWAYESGYKKGLSIERVDINGDYEPSNCIFIPVGEQSENRRINHRITINGETHSLSKWCTILGMNRGTVRGRIARGWDVEKALTTPVKKNG